MVSLTGVNFGSLVREGFSNFDPVGAMDAKARQRTAEPVVSALAYSPPGHGCIVRAGSGCPSSEWDGTGVSRRISTQAAR